jgi:hypothetical protein
MCSRIHNFNLDFFLFDDDGHLSVAHPSAEAIAWPWRGGPKSGASTGHRRQADATGSPLRSQSPAAVRMAAAAALRCCFPGSAIGSGFVRSSSSRRGRSAAAVAAPSREAEPAASLGDRTRVDFPILHQVTPPSVSVSSADSWDTVKTTSDFM